MQKMINDYVAEYESCLEVLDEPLKEHTPTEMHKPKIDPRKIPDVDSLFDDHDDVFDVKKHWAGMPEYDNRDIKSFAEITVKFLSKEDMKTFSKLVDQTITEKTKSITYPKKPPGKDVNNRWCDETEVLL